MQLPEPATCVSDGFAGLLSQRGAQDGAVGCRGRQGQAVTGIVMLGVVGDGR